MIIYRVIDNDICYLVVAGCVNVHRYERNIKIYNRLNPYVVNLSVSFLKMDCVLISGVVNERSGSETTVMFCSR